LEVLDLPGTLANREAQDILAIPDIQVLPVALGRRDQRVKLAKQDTQASRDLRAHVETRASLVQLDRQAQLAHRDLRDKLDKLDHQALPGLLVQVDPWDHRVRQDTQALREAPAVQEPLGRQAVLVSLDRLAHKDNRVPLDRREIQAKLAFREHLVPQGSLVQQVTQVQLDPLEVLVLSGLRDPRDQWDIQDKQVHRDQLDLLGLPELREQLESRVKLASQDRVVKLVSKEPLVIRAAVDCLVSRAP
jgi:hypothetical protein